MKLPDEVRPVTSGNKWDQEACITCRLGGYLIRQILRRSTEKWTCRSSARADGVLAPARGQEQGGLHTARLDTASCLGPRASEHDFASQSGTPRAGLPCQPSHLVSVRPPGQSVHRRTYRRQTACYEVRCGHPHTHRLAPPGDARTSPAGAPLTACSQMRFWSLQLWQTRS